MQSTQFPFRAALLLVTLLVSCLAGFPEFPAKLDALLSLSEQGAQKAGTAPFSVLVAEPHSEVDPSQSPLITFVFSRPLRASSAECGAVPDSFTASTDAGQPVPGSFRCVGLHGMLFQPAHLLAGSTGYQVKIPAGTRAADGAVLPSDYVLRFRTESVKLLDSVPSQGSSLVETRQPILLRFSQEINPEELQRQLKLSALAPQSREATPILFKVSRHNPNSSGTGAWLRIDPSVDLPLRSEIEITVPPGLLSQSGPLATSQPLRWSGTTHGKLELEDVHCPRVNLGRCQVHGDFSVALTTPVSPSEFKRHIKLIGPKRTVTSKGKSKPAKTSDKPVLVHPLGLDPEYGDRFEIKLLAGMKDSFGQQLSRDVSVSIEVEAPYVTSQPSQATGVPSTKTDNTNVLDGVGPPPDAPHRLSLPYELQFGVRGNLVEARAQESGDTLPNSQLQLGFVNLPTVGLRTQLLPELAAVRWLGRRDGGLGEAGNPDWEWFGSAGASNVRGVRTIDLSSSLGRNQRGTLLLEAKALGASDTQSSFLSVTDLGISTHAGRRGSVVWVTQLSTGKPAPLATLSLYSKDGAELIKRQTDAQGVVEFAEGELLAPPRYGGFDQSRILVARLEHDWTYQRIETSLPTNPGLDVDYVQNQSWVGLVFTDRGVYRPGEHLHAGGYFRRTAERNLVLKTGQEFEYTLTDANDEMLVQGRSQLDKFGSFALDLPLPKTTSIGSAQLVVRLDRDANSRFATSFQVLHYKAAEFKVSVSPTIREIVHGSEAQFATHAEYLYGAPMNDVRLEAYFTSSEVSFAPPGSEGLATTDSAFLRDLSFSPRTSGMVGHQLQTLNPEGNAQSNLKLDWPSPEVPVRIALEGEVQDVGGQSQSSRASVLVHPAEYYLGLKPPPQRFLPVGAQLPALVSALSPTGKLLAGVQVKLELFHRSYNATIEDRATNPLYVNTRVHDDLEAECQFATGTSPRCTLRISQSGYFVLRASALDTRGNPVHASASFYAVDDRADTNSSGQTWREGERRLLGLETDKDSYSEGETAKVLVKNPFKRATALVSVERGGILWRQVVEISGPTPTLEIPVRKEFFPNAYVAVHLVRGRIAAMPKPTPIPRADIGAPQFRVGYVALKVNPESRRVNVEVTPERQTYRPGAPVQARVQLTDASGKPLSGSVTFYVVDEGTLALSNYQTPDPLGAFSGMRPLGVFPIDNRQHLAQFIDLESGKRLAAYGWETPEGSGYGDKGYEGGDGGSELRSDFRTTIYFEAGRAVGPDGQAVFHFKLPDNLTTFRLMAVAAAEGDRFGSGQGKLAVNKSLMLRPQLPRFLRVGDTAQAGAVLSLMPGTVQAKAVAQTAANITLTTTDPQGGASVQTQKVTLSKAGQSEVLFNINTQQTGEYRFDFKATLDKSAGGETDSVKVTRQATAPTHVLSAAVYGATSGRSSIGLALPSEAIEAGNVQVEVRTDPLVGLGDVFSALDTYPYGCTEQLASRVIPYLAATDLISAGDGPKARPAWLDEALGEIVKHQTYDGRFGFWESDTAGPLWLTGYAMLALELGNQAGYFVPRHVRNLAANALDRGFEELLQSLEREGENSNNSEDPSVSPGADDTNSEGLDATGTSSVPSAANLGVLRAQRLAQAAYVANVLARTGGASAPKLRRLLRWQKELPLSAKAQLAEALHRTKATSGEVQSLLNDVLAASRVGDWEARFELQTPELAALFDSPARTTAWTLQALIAASPEHTAVDKFARGLANFRTGASYRNPQENAWALLALSEYKKLHDARQRKQAASASADNGSHIVSVLWPTQKTVDLALDSGRSQKTSSQLSELWADLSGTASLPVSQSSSQKGKPLLQLVNTGETPVYYSVSVTATLRGNAHRAVDAGLSIEKHLQAVVAEDLKQLPSILSDAKELRAPFGQLVVTELLVETTMARDQLVIDDPLAAGLEALDINLETSNHTLQALSDSSAIASSSNSTWSLRQPNNLRREIRDDRVLIFIPHLEPGIHRIRYLARAATRGRFLLPATRVSCMYEPEVFGQTAARSLEIGSVAPHS